MVSKKLVLDYIKAINVVSGLFQNSSQEWVTVGVPRKGVFSTFIFKNIRQRLFCLPLKKGREELFNRPHSVGNWPSGRP